MLITIIFAIFMQVVVARKWSNSSSNLLKVSSPTCSSDTAQVPLNVFFGYNSDGKTEQSKSDGLKGFNSFKNWLNDYPDRSSFSYKTTRLNGYMWVGSMIKNSDFSNSNAFKVLYDEINTSGMPETLYIEYVTGDPKKGFGAIFTTKSNNFVEAQKAVKLWSEGKAYNSYKGYKYYKAKVICYLLYNKRKSIVNDNEAGNCNHFLVILYIVYIKKRILLFLVILSFGFCYEHVHLKPRKIYDKPTKNSDGSCPAYTVLKGDTCYLISAHYSMKQEELIKFNENKAYSWKGCDKLTIGQGICLSDGTPPKPKSDPKAECGPYAPGNWKTPPECPNKACCSEWGYCGLTSQFCEKSNNCFSNCGYGKLHTDTRSDFDNIAYWMDSEGKLAYDPQLLNGKYSMVHYAFVNIKSDFSIDDSKFKNSEFLYIEPKKVASFGGWDFSTNPSTYKIFRDGVKPANRDKFATNIADFANKYNLDGIDLDWEYPAEPDIPDIPADSKDSTQNYVDFVKLLKSKLGSKTLQVAKMTSCKDDKLHWTR